MKTTCILLACCLALVACSGSDQPAAPAPQPADDNPVAPGPDPNAARCGELLTELRALRDGPQPCAKADDCTVFHHGEDWDGCQVEVNKTNGAELDRLRAEIDGLGCPVDKGGQCASMEVMWCVAGGCGGNAPPR